MTEKEIQEGIDWIRARPKAIRELMVKFPPSCRVRALRPLRTPSPGKEGVVISYIENEMGPPSLRVQEPDGEVAAECLPEWLEVVGYWEHATPEFVKLAIEGL
jgi:hypothetical protein